jgi:peptide/nickel transport system substrate-binding protein
MVRIAPQVAALLALVACDSPARVKPWRHAPDPEAQADLASGSPSVLADTPSETELHAARGHTLRIHVDADPGRLTALVQPSVWARRITLGTIFEPLLRYIPDPTPDPAHGPGRFAPRLARSWRVMPAGNEIRIELEPNVTFHDGTPLTTSDVQFTLDAIRDPRKGIDHLRPMLDDVDRIELITAKEIRLVLKRPSGWVLRALAEIPILPMHVYDGSLVAGGALVGTGPWKYVSNKGGVVHLARYDKYWAGPSPIADVEFVYQPDAALALTQAKRGELDIVPALIATHWPKQAESPGLRAAFRSVELRPPRFRYLAFNATRAPLDDPNVRHAISLVIDRRAIAKKVFDGLERPALWPVWPGGPVDANELAIPDRDPAAAGKLLDTAGWMTTKDGYREKDGKPLKLVLVALEHPKDPAAPAEKTERDLILAGAKAAGIRIEIKTGSEAWLAKHVSEGAYDLAELSWGGMVDMDVTQLVAGKDPSRAASARVDRALDAMAAAWDPGERQKLSRELVASLADVWPIAGLVAAAPQGLVHRRLKGVKVADGWIDLGALSFDDTK